MFLFFYFDEIEGALRYKNETPKMEKILLY